MVYKPRCPRRLPWCPYVPWKDIYTRTGYSCCHSPSLRFTFLCHVWGFCQAQAFQNIHIEVDGYVSETYRQHTDVKFQKAYLAFMWTEYPHYHDSVLLHVYVRNSFVNVCNHTISSLECSYIVNLVKSPLFHTRNAPPPSLSPCAWCMCKSRG